MVVDSLNAREFRKDLYLAVKTSLHTIANNPTLKHVIRRLVPYFLLVSFTDIILLTWDIIDWSVVPTDQLKKLSRLLIDDYHIANYPQHRKFVMRLASLSEEMEVYIIMRICRNTIDTVCGCSKHNSPVGIPRIPPTHEAHKAKSTLHL